MNEKLVRKLEKWVNENPCEADLVTVNMRTGKTFTVRTILEVVKNEKRGILTEDKDILDVVNEIENWIKEVKF